MTVNELKKFASDVRIETVKCLEARTFGHIGGCLSIADVLTVLYSGELKNIDPADPKKLDRDMLVVSKGHAGPAVFATLALKGYFPLDWLPTLCEGARASDSSKESRQSLNPRRSYSARHPAFAMFSPNSPCSTKPIFLPRYTPPKFPVERCSIPRCLHSISLKRSMAEPDGKVSVRRKQLSSLL